MRQTPKLTLINFKDSTTINKKETPEMAKSNTDDLNILELHEEQLREARIKLMGVLENYVTSQGLPIREAVLLFGKANMWDGRKAATYLDLMSAPDSVFKKVKLYKEFGGSK